ncbi:ATP-binding cassette domain-containing protein, partial [Streptomyces sp. NPDC005180]|uniref:ATP-binding cassette domain-containing protein n=1 Tax=Streptomyces sp. NPDC005180 TaxID=3156868 RepID=UPI0033BB237A
MTTPVLSVRDLSVSFRGDARTVHAVDSVSYDLAAGEVLAVVGESGCGKSVTSMAVMGLLPPTARVEGSVRLAGRELAGADERTLGKIRGKDIAMIFQEPMTSLNPVLTVGRQITEVLRRHQGLRRREAVERAVELLTLVGIPASRRRIDEYPHQLSGGSRVSGVRHKVGRMNDRMVWIDCEMTGLSLADDALIEVAALVTDSELNVLGEGVDIV